jgi:hypothetical protein
MPTVQDLSWLSIEAQKIHGIFESTFWLLITTLLALAVVLEFFKIQLGNVPQFQPLIGRVFLAALLLHAFPEIANTIADVTDSFVAALGGFNEFSHVLGRMGDKLHDLSWSWTSVKDSVVLLLSFTTFFLLYISVFIANAGVIFVWSVLYIFSPLLIGLFVLPATASATTVLFRSLFEVCAWKIVWAVLATLLWSFALSTINQPEQNVNFLTVISLNLILAASLLFTPMIVHALTTAGITTLSAQMTGLAMAAPMFNPGSMATKPVKGAVGAAVGGAGGAAIAGGSGSKSKTGRHFSGGSSGGNSKPPSSPKGGH